VIQSLFGVGVLLFGTPLLLLFGFDFITTLIILLPTSLIINSIQVFISFKNIDYNFYKKMLLYTIPFIVFFLFFVVSTRLNINLYVGLFLIFISIQSQFPTIGKHVSRFMKFESIYLSLMGLIHGLTNLGGSLLTAIIVNKKYSKDKTRVTIAVCYLTFAFFQIITLFLITGKSLINYFDYAKYWLIGVLIFIIVEKIIYVKIEENKYAKFFQIFLFTSGLILLVK